MAVKLAPVLSRPFIHFIRIFKEAGINNILKRAEICQNICICPGEHFRANSGKPF